MKTSEPTPVNAKSRLRRSPVAWAIRIVLLGPLLFGILLTIYAFRLPHPEIPYAAFHRILGIAVLVVGLVFALLIWRRPAVVRAKIACSIATLAFAMVIAEVIVYALTYPSIHPVYQWTHAQEIRSQRARERGIPFDRRTPAEAYDEIHRQHDRVDNMAFTGPQRLHGEDVYVFSGQADKIWMLGNENGYFATYRSDEQGFNNPPGLWSPTPVDIVALGDSFVHGNAVRQGEDICSVLRKRYPKTVNLGWWGSGPLRELATLMEYGPALRPRVVVWFFWEGNDFPDLQREMGIPLLRRYLEGEGVQGLIQRKPELDRYAATLPPSVYSFSQEEPVPLKKHLACMLRFEGLRHRLHLSERNFFLGVSLKGYRWTYDYDLLGTILQRAREVSATWGGKLLFVYLPQYERYDHGKDRIADRVRDGKREAVLELVAQKNVPVLDLCPVFAERENPKTLFPFEWIGHYTAEGYALVADTVADRIKQQGWLKEPPPGSTPFEHDEGGK